MGTTGLRVSRSLTSNAQGKSRGRAFIQRDARQVATDFDKAFNDKWSTLAEWVAFQVHHQGILDLFWKGRNSLVNLWDTYERVQSKDAALRAMRDRGVQILPSERAPGDPKTRFSDASFGVAYAAWSFAKGCKVAARLPDEFAYCAPWQRRDCRRAVLRTITQKSEMELVRFFPWGAMLNVFKEHLYSDDAWLPSALASLRTYALRDFGKLLEKLPSLREEESPVRKGGTVVDFTATFQSSPQRRAVEEFAHEGLGLALPSWEEFVPPGEVFLLFKRAVTAGLCGGTPERWIDHSIERYEEQLSTELVEEQTDIIHRMQIVRYENALWTAINAKNVTNRSVSAIDAMLKARGF